MKNFHLQKTHCTKRWLIGSEIHSGRGNLTKYHKAIRDKIPEIIAESGKKCNVKILSDEEFLEKLEEKLTEEVLEYQESKSLEELADILEVIDRILKIKGIKKGKLEEIQIMKKDERGGFDKNLFLIDTNEK